MVAALGLGAVYAILTVIVNSGATLGPDTRIILGVGAGQSPALIPVMRAASWVAGDGAIPLALLLALVLLQRASGRLSALYATACLSGWGLNLLLKEITQRVRPDGISPKLTGAGFYSFPSGHTMLATLVFGFGALLLARTVQDKSARMAILVAGAVTTLLVGASRVYLGAHWPSDVLGAVLAGAAWAAACLAIAGRSVESGPPSG